MLIQICSAQRNDRRPGDRCGLDRFDDACLTHSTSPRRREALARCTNRWTSSRCSCFQRDEGNAAAATVSMPPARPLDRSSPVRLSCASRKLMGYAALAAFRRGLSQAGPATAAYTILAPPLARPLRWTERTMPGRLQRPIGSETSGRPARPSKRTVPSEPAGFGGAPIAAQGAPQRESARQRPPGPAMASSLQRS